MASNIVAFLWQCAPYSLSLAPSDGPSPLVSDKIILFLSFQARVFRWHVSDMSRLERATFRYECGHLPYSRIKRTLAWYGIGFRFLYFFSNKFVLHFYLLVSTINFFMDHRKSIQHLIFYCYFFLFLNDKLTKAVQKCIQTLSGFKPGPTRFGGRHFTNLVIASSGKSNHYHHQL